MIIGVTGGIGSGKSTVAKFFSEKENVAIYIADIEAKNLMNTSSLIKERLVAEFGEESYVNHELNRKHISEIVFKNKEKLAILNSIVHPEVKKHFKLFVERNSEKSYIVYENAILFETSNNLFCDFVISVYVDLETRIQRIMERDSCSEKDVLSRINNQWKEEKKTLQSNYLITNVNLESTQLQVNYIHNILTKKIR